MALEQYSEETNFSKVDIFALGVIFTELFSGYHPIGERTSDIWPEPIHGKPRKWKHEGEWKKWAKKEEKIDPQIVINPGSLKDLFSRMLLNDGSKRPEFEEIEGELMSALKDLDKNMYLNVEAVLQYFDQLAQESIKLDRESQKQYSQLQLRKIYDIPLHKS
jgi:serine/threonine protein kinase